MLRILVVDRDAATLDLTREVLFAVGGEAATVTSAREALDLSEHDQFDAVLLEWLLPPAKGIETIALIQERWPRLPIIAMSERSPLLSAEEARSLVMPVGVRPLQKPFLQSELLLALAAARASFWA